MTKEREQILRMLAEGKISVDEAERLLDAVGTGAVSDQPETVTSDSCKSKLKYLRIRVDPGPGSRHKRVNIRVPLQLVRAGAKFASLIPGEAREKIHSSLHEKGMDIDFDNLTCESLEDMCRALGEMDIDIDDGEEKVRICCE